MQVRALPDVQSGPWCALVYVDRGVRAPERVSPRTFVGVSFSRSALDARAGRVHLKGMTTRTIGQVMRDWLADGHIFAQDAVKIEMSGTFAWVNEAETGIGLRLFANRAAAEKSIRLAAARAHRNRA